jgi:hypothetical protein
MKRLVTSIGLVLGLVAVTSPAGAITFGESDEGAHPNVGELLVDFGGGPERICSGTLIAPRVFLTAAHCAAWIPGVEGDPLTQGKVSVTFADEVDSNSTFYVASGIDWDRAYGVAGGGADTHDIAVVVLRDDVQSAAGIEPAMLPTAGQLSYMKKEAALRDKHFTAVGYGCDRSGPTGGPSALDCSKNERRTVEQAFLALRPTWLELSMNPSTGSGGACNWDSGGPHFIDDDTDTIASITVGGDAYCRATDTTYRLDTANARAFLANHLTLP